MNIFGGENFAAWWILLGLGPWCMVKFVVKFWWILLKRKIKANKILPILRRKLRRILALHSYSETSPQTSPAQIRQQINMLPLWALTQTCMFIGMNLATIEQK